MEGGWREGDEGVKQVLKAADISELSSLKAKADPWLQDNYLTCAIKLRDFIYWLIKRGKVNVSACEAESSW